MKAISVIVGAVLLLWGSAPAAEEEVVAVTGSATNASPAKRSIMLYLQSSEGYPLRNEPIIITEREVPQYRAGIRACDTLMQICRPREDGTFLNPGTPEEQKRYCGPLEPASSVTCTIPLKGSFH